MSSWEQIDAFLQDLGLSKSRRPAVATPGSQGSEAPRIPGLQSGPGAGLPPPVFIPAGVVACPDGSQVFGGLTQERCLQALMQYGYDAEAAKREVMAAAASLKVVWNKVGAAGSGAVWVQGCAMGCNVLLVQRALQLLPCAPPAASYSPPV